MNLFNFIQKKIESPYGILFLNKNQFIFMSQVNLVSFYNKNKNV